MRNDLGEEGLRSLYGTGEGTGAVLPLRVGVELQRARSVAARPLAQLHRMCIGYRSIVLSMVKLRRRKGLHKPCGRAAQEFEPGHLGGDAAIAQGEEHTVRQVIRSGKARELPPERSLSDVSNLGKEEIRWGSDTHHGLYPWIPNPHQECNAPTAAVPKDCDTGGICLWQHLEHSTEQRHGILHITVPGVGQAT